MKIALAILVVFLALCFGFAYFHSRSIDRAHLINSANALLAVQEHLHQHGSITNASTYTRVYGFTNRVTIGGVDHFTELAADVPGLTHAGRLVAATNGLLIWIDKRSGPVIMRGTDHQVVIPQRFHDL